MSLFSKKNKMSLFPIRNWKCTMLKQLVNWGGGESEVLFNLLKYTFSLDAGLNKSLTEHQSGKYKEIVECIKKDNDINAQDDDGNNALHIG